MLLDRVSNTSSAEQQKHNLAEHTPVIYGSISAVEDAIGRDFDRLAGELHGAHRRQHLLVIHEFIICFDFFFQFWELL